jgi:hypothetical protein
VVLGLDRLEPECQKVEPNPAVVMRLLDRRMTQATSVGGLMRLRLWGPPNFVLWRKAAQPACPRHVGSVGAKRTRYAQSGFFRM